MYFIVVYIYCADSDLVRNPESVLYLLMYGSLPYNYIVNC